MSFNHCILSCGTSSATLRVIQKYGITAYFASDNGDKYDATIESIIDDAFSSFPPEDPPNIRKFNRLPSNSILICRAEEYVVIWNKGIHYVNINDTLVILDTGTYVLSAIATSVIFSQHQVTGVKENAIKEALTNFQKNESVYTNTWIVVCDTQVKKYNNKINPHIADTEVDTFYILCKYSPLKKYCIERSKEIGLLSPDST